MAIYNHDFYKTMIEGSERSASLVLPEIFKGIKVESMLDFGCGVGCWLKVARDLGVKRVIGLDGSYVSVNQLRIPAAEFHAIDLSCETPPVHRVDLAISLEVAEHLPHERADGVVEYLTSCADNVFFGAAIPAQGGTKHINEQWQSFWAEKFYRRGFSCSTKIRDSLWNVRDIGVWYRQNALLFTRGDAVCGGQSNGLLDVVHPELYSAKMRRYRYHERAMTAMQSIKNAIASV
jgi:hypothetical protein